MTARKWQDMPDKLPEKLIAVHKYCKVASRDGHEFFFRCLKSLEILSSKLGRCREIFCSLEEKYGNGEF